MLGSEQHGHLLSVGYDMYLKLLEEAVSEAQGKESTGVTDCQAELNVEAGIPETYVPPSGERMDLYRRIAALRDEEEASDIREELRDRFGPPPPTTEALIEIALLRAFAARCGITDITQKNDRIVFTLAPERKPDFQKISTVCGLPDYRGRILFSAGDTPQITLRLGPPETRVMSRGRRAAAALETGRTGRAPLTEPKAPPPPPPGSVLPACRGFLAVFSG